MKSKRFATCILALSFVASHVMAQSIESDQERWRECSRGARTPAAIVNYDNVAITTGSGKAMTAEQVRQAFLAGIRDSKWSASVLPDGKLSATLNVRGKHTITVEIAYSPEKYSLRYKDSTNMHYAMCYGQGIIHPNYNKWVSNLKRSIETKLQAL